MIEHPLPLWKQLEACSQVIQDVRTGVSGTAAIESHPVALRPGVQALAFHVWRNLGRAEALRDLLATKKPPPAADALLSVALALIWSKEAAPYDAHTLVNQAVEAAKKNPRTRPQANFINGCLRRYLREQEPLNHATEQDPVAHWNHPLWWIKRLQREYPAHWEDLLDAANATPPLTLRVNCRATNVAAYRMRLAAQGVQADAMGGHALRLAHALPVSALPGFEAGQVSVQDYAAQLAAPLLVNGLLGSERLRILDACAAPGGKTGHLLELADADVTALEISSKRSRLIAQNLARLGLQAQVLQGDAGQLDAWWDGLAYDAVLLDAPCTASGIARRHPDIRWLRRESDIVDLAAVQQRLLRTLWATVRPGGRLLFCTCSIFLAEGSGQVQTFLTHNSDALLLPSPGHLLPGVPNKFLGVPDNQACDHDGFFYALFQKQSQ